MNSTLKTRIKEKIKKTILEQATTTNSVCFFGFYEPIHPRLRKVEDKIDE